MHRTLPVLALLAACSTPLQGALRPTGIEIGGEVVMSLPKTGSNQQLESALLPARGKRVLIRVEEGVTYQSLTNFLVTANAVGVSTVQLEHDQGCRHETPSEEVGSPHFTIAISRTGYFLAMESPPPSPPEGSGEGAPTIATVNGLLSYEALDTRLRKDLATLAPFDGMILAAEPDTAASDVLRTWDVIKRQPGIRNVRLASF